MVKARSWRGRTAIASATLLFVAIGCGGGGANPDGGSAGQDGSAGDGGGTSPAALAGTWLGPARLAPCSDLVALPGVSSEIVVGPIELVIDAQGEVERVRINNQDFAVDPTDEYYPTLSVLDPRLVHLSFDNVSDAPTGLSNPSMLPAIDGGGLVLELEQNGDVVYAFVYVHDMWGCDLVTGVLEKNASSIPSYSLADLNGTWQGSSAQFTDQTGVDGVPLQLIFDGFQSPWSLTITAGAVTGSLADHGNAVTIVSGTVAVTDGFFQGTLTGSGDASWSFEGLLSPDRSFFAGFSYPEPWVRYWHDVLLTK